MDIGPYSTIDASVEAGYAVVTLNRPPVNALIPEMVADIRSCFTELNDHVEINSVILAASGHKAFCAGTDLHHGDASTLRGKDPLSVVDPGRDWREAQASIRHCLVPVIAAVEAAAVGAGFGLLGVCDLIVASRSAQFSLPEIDVGLLGGASKALRMVGPYWARYMSFTGVPISSEDLKRSGAVIEVTEPGEALDRAVELATVIAAKSPLAVRLAKEAIVRIEPLEFEEAYRTEQDYTSRLRGSADAEEARLAYLEKRPPRWSWTD